MTKRLTILASWQPTLDVPEYIRLHLEGLRPVSARLVFVSNSPLSDAARTSLSAICDDVVERANTGFDFAAWRDVILATDMSEFDEVVLTNSSLVGPFSDLAPIFAEMDEKPCDFWGLTRNRMLQLHLQSFFLVFRKRLINSADWTAFWRSVTDESNKEVVIRKYEIKLEAHFNAVGYHSESLIPAASFPLSRRLAFRRFRRFPVISVPCDRNFINMTITSPLYLIENGFPYLKASLVWGHNVQQGFPLEAIRKLPGVDYDWSVLERPVQPTPARA